MALTAIDKIKRFKVAANRKQGWANIYEEALKYSAPQRNSFSSVKKGGLTNNVKVFDSTAQIAMQKFASNLQSSLVPPAKKWINLISGNGTSSQEKDLINKALEEVRNIFFDYVHMSNFDTQISECFLDLAVGTGALLVLKGNADQPLRFISVPLSQVYLEEGAYGEISTAFRKHKLAVRNIHNMWPDAMLNDTLKVILEDNPDKEIEFIESTIASKIIKYNPFTEQDEEVDGYIYSVTFEADKFDLVVREQESSPWVIFRYSTMPGEIYGRGPLLTALPDIKTLNKTKELVLKNASLAVAGAYTVADDGVINVNNVKIRPGALIPVGSNGGVNGPTLLPLPRSGDFNVGQLIIDDLQKSINDALFADPLGKIDAPTKSATEIAIRQQELVTRIGSAFGRLQFELLGPLVQRILYVLEEQGLVDLNPFRIDASGISIEYVSPLAMAQDQEELMGIMRYVEFISKNFGAEHPLLQLKSVQIAQKVAEFLGVSSIAFSTTELEQIETELLKTINNKNGE